MGTLNGEAALRPQSRNSVQRPQSRNSMTSNSPGLSVQGHSSNGWMDDFQRRSSILGTNVAGAVDQDADGQVHMQLGQVQVAIDSARSEHFQTQQMLLEEFRDIRYDMEQRNTWLEQKLHAVDRRLEKVEKASDRVSAGMQSINSEELSAAIDSLKSALERSDGGLRTTAQPLHGPPLSSPAKEESLQASSQWPGVTTPGSDSPFDDRMLLNLEKDRRHMEQKLDKILEQVQPVITLQEEAAETRRLLWKIDLSLRQMRTGGAVTSPLPQDSAEQATRSAAASPPAPRPSLGATTHTPSDRRASANTGNPSNPTSRVSS